MGEDLQQAHSSFPRMPDVLGKRTPAKARFAQSSRDDDDAADDDDDSCASRRSDLTSASAASSVRTFARGAQTALRTLASAHHGRSSRSLKALSSKEEEIDRMEGEYLERSSRLTRSKNEEIAELRVKVSGRESALIGLERNCRAGEETVRTLRRELEEARAEGTEREAMWRARFEDVQRELDEARRRRAARGEDEEGRFRAEADALRAKHESEATELRAENEALKKKVHDEKEIIVRQNDQMQEFQTYIIKLTDELERLHKEMDKKKRALSVRRGEAPGSKGRSSGRQRRLRKRYASKRASGGASFKSGIVAIMEAEEEEDDDDSNG